MSPTFASLGIRNYRHYFAGMLASNTGVWMQRVAQDWLVLTLTGGSGSALGITIGLQFAPFLVFSLWGGTLADRLGRKRILMATQSAMALLALILGSLTLAGSATVTQVYAMSLLLGIVSALDSPARQAFVGEMVGASHLANAVALSSASFNIGRIAGPSVAGLLIALVGTGWVFMLNAAMFVIALWALASVRGAELAAPLVRDESVRFRDAVRYVRQRPSLMLVLVIVFAVGTFGFNFQLTLALMTTEAFQGSASQFGLLSTALASGALLGSLLSARRGLTTHGFVVRAATAFALLEIAASMMPTFLALALLLPLVGVLALTFSNSAQSFLQMGTAPAMRGRVMGIYALVFFGGTPLGAPLFGQLADHVGPRWTLAVGGLGVLAVVAVATAVVRRRSGTTARPALATAGVP